MGSAISVSIKRIMQKPMWYIDPVAVYFPKPYVALPSHVITFAVANVAS